MRGSRRLGARLILLLGLAWALLTPGAGWASYGAHFGRSALHTGAYGTRALYRLVEEEGAEVRLWDRPLWGDLGKEAGLVVLLAPTEPLAPEELDALLRHVQAGGRLIVVAGAAGAEGETLEGDVAAGLGVLIPFGLRVAVAREAGAAPALLPLQTLPKTPLPVVGAIPQRGGLRLSWLVEPPGEAHVLLEDDAGLAAVAFSYGRGVVVAVADLAPFSNRWLGEDASGAFALGLVEAFRGERPVLWDVFHHGVRAKGGGLKAFLASPMAVAGIHGLLVGALGLLWFGRREVAVRGEDAAPPGGDVGAQVSALADLYGRTGGAAMAVEPILRDGARRVGARLGLPPETPSEDAIAAGCEAVGQGRGDLKGLIEKARESGGEGAALALTRRLDKLLGRLEDVPR